MVEGVQQGPGAESPDVNDRKYRKIIWSNSSCFSTRFFDEGSICDICFLPCCTISKMCISPLLYRTAEALHSNTLSRRQSNTQVNKCTGVPDQHEVCIYAVHVNRVIKLCFCYYSPISLMST